MGSGRCKLQKMALPPLNNLLLILCLVLVIYREVSASRSIDERMNDMSLQDKIGQMTQCDLSLLLESDSNGMKKVSQKKADRYVGQLGVGSVFNAPLGGVVWTAAEFRQNIYTIQESAKKYNRPPVIFGLDSVHGANYIKGAILTPHQINLAATFDVNAPFFVGVLASRDSRAAGVNWLFSPVLGIAMNPKWSRVYETFGEDPLVVSRMGSSLIKGIQFYSDEVENHGIPSRAAACGKHFLGYSMPLNGHDRSPSWIPKRHLYQYFLPSFRDAVKEGNVMTMMHSYSEYDGVPMASSRDALVNILRKELKFNGVLVTDYQEIENLVSWHHVARDNDEAVKLSLAETSIDMSMVPFDIIEYQERVERSVTKDGEISSSGDIPYPSHPKSVSIDRINESVRRILELKEKLGMFDEEISPDMNDLNMDLVGSESDQDMALQIAKSSIILAKNDAAALPIINSSSSNARTKIFVAGPTADSIRYQSGGWSLDWQGSQKDGFFWYGKSILRGLRDEAKKEDSFISLASSCGVDIMGEMCIDNLPDVAEGLSSISTAASMAQEADYIVICVGEESYSEKPGDIHSLALPSGQYDLVRAIKKAVSEAGRGGKIILVVIGGRPRLLQNMVNDSDAVLLAFLPGPDGGLAISDIIMGMHNPSGRLPITYPRYEDASSSPYFTSLSSQCTIDTGGGLPHYEYEPCKPEFTFGHGLSYTSFMYSDFVISSNILTIDFGSDDSPENIDIFLTVTNTGQVYGSETILFFVFIESRYTTPESKRLIGFDKVSLKPRESATVSTSISIDDMRFIGPHDDTHLVLQDGMRFQIGVGPDADCRHKDSKTSSVCSKFVSVQLGDQYVSSCEAACEAWDDSGCGSEFHMDRKECRERCLISDENEGWGWNYVTCIEEVIHKNTNGSGSTKQCYKMNELCRDIFAVETHNVSGGEKNLRAEFLVACSAGFLGLIIIFRSFRARSQNKRSRVELVPQSDSDFS